MIAASTGSAPIAVLPGLDEQRRRLVDVSSNSAIWPRMLARRGLTANPATSSENARACAASPVTSIRSTARSSRDSRASRVGSRSGATRRPLRAPPIAVTAPPPCAPRAPPADPRARRPGPRRRRRGWRSRPASSSGQLGGAGSAARAAGGADLVVDGGGQRMRERGRGHAAAVVDAQQAGGHRLLERVERLVDVRQRGRGREQAVRAEDRDALPAAPRRRESTRWCGA